MRHLFLTALVATTALTVPTAVIAQSSSPFSGLFGGKDDSSSPVTLDIRVAGDDGSITRDLRNSSLIGGALTEGRSTGQDMLAAARADYARILGTLYDKAYYSAIVTITLDGVEAASIAPLDAPEFVSRVVVSVDPGPQFRFRQADIAPLAPKTELPGEYAAGQVAGTGTIKSAARAGISGWRQAGHAKADVTGQNIVADHSSDTVDSEVTITPGPAVTFGKLNISGQERMNLRRLRKIAGFDSGSRFDPDHIDTVRTRLRRTGVFSAMTLTEADFLNPDNSLDVDLAVVEQKTRRIGAGFEISNTDGAMVSAYWMHRNLFGGAERLRIEGEVGDIGSDNSGLDRSFSIRLERPASFHPDVTAYIEAVSERLDEEDYDATNRTFTFGANYIRSERLTADTAIQYVYNKVTDETGTSTYEAIAFPTNVTWDKRDEPTDAKRGYWLSGDITPFVGIGDTGSGAQIIGEGRAFRSFGTDDRLTLAGRARLGTIVGPDIADTPRDYLFWSGGGGTVRGQPYESLGVNVIPGPDGAIETGGMSLAMISAELRWQAREKIGLVAFADAARLWTDSTWQGDSDWHAGAGLGIRYKTPIGPLRFDIAGPVAGDTGSGVQLYLGLGQAF